MNAQENAQEATNAQELVRLPGSTQVGVVAQSFPVSILLPRGGIVDQVKVLTQGSEGLDFQNAGDDCKASHASGQTCTVQIAFRPSSPGERRGAIVLLDRSGTPLASRPLAASALGAIVTFLPGQIITVAGNANTFFFAGDGGAATSAALFLPFGVSLDGAGDMYIADTYNQRIRVVNKSTGVITTVAGSGSTSSAGNGSALDASLNNPSTVALDAAGNIYIADTDNNAVRMVSASTGLISTFAGTIGTPGYSGDHGEAVLATLNTPNGLAFDAAGNLYIADTGNNVVRVVNAVTHIITTFAGNGSAAYAGDTGQAAAAALNAPYGVTVSTAGELYIADQGNNVVRKVATSGVISTIAGRGTAGFSGDGGVATRALLATPASVAIDIAGNVYIADSGNNRVRKINPVTQVINTIAGGPNADPDDNPATLANLSGPFALAIDGAGNLDIADAFHNRIRQVQANVGIQNFTVTRINSVTAPRGEVLENDGTATLNITSITAGANAQVDSATTTCSSSTPLASLARCNIGADFAPTVLGNPIRGTITVDSNALNANGTLIVQGGVESTDPSTVLVSSSPNPSLVGNPVLFTIQAISAGVVPTGTVMLLDGTTTIATLTLTNGIASISLSNLAVGQHTITASYGGDTNNAASVSLPLIQVVDVLPANSNTTTSLTSSVNPIQVGLPLTLNATVAAVATGQSTPTGTVSFMEGTTVLGTGILSSGITSTTISTLSAGTHMITAVYSGSATYATSTSPVLTQIVTALNPVTTTSLTSNADPIGVGATLTLSSTVSAVGMGQAVPTGTISFMEGTTVLGTGTLANGTASINVTNLAVGTNLITAVYGGDASYSGSTSTVLTEIVTSGSTGNAPQFSLQLNPTSLTIPSGSHATVQITLTTASTFSDTLSFGCAGLPAAATCTFSQSQVATTGDLTKVLSVVIDTANPLGSGAAAEVHGSPFGGSAGVLACALPGAFFGFVLFRRRAVGRTTIGSCLFGAILALAVLAGITGCGGSFNGAKSPAGTYTVQVFASGTNTGESLATPVQLTVTQ